MGPASCRGRPAPAALAAGAAELAAPGVPPPLLARGGQRGLGAAGTAASTPHAATAAAALAVAGAAAASAARGGRRRRGAGKSRLVRQRRRAEGAETRRGFDGEGAFFGPWADWLERHLLAALPALRRHPLPSHLASAGKPPAAAIGTRVFSGEFAEGCPIRRFRVTLVSDGEKLQAMNAAAYPAYELGPVPILGADLLSFNGHQRLLFGVDWAPMATDEAYSEAHVAPYLAELRRGPRFAALAGDPTGRFYGQRPEFFSPHMFFARPDGATALQPEGALWQVFREYASQYLAMLRDATAASTSAVQLAKRRQADFDHWHAERDPALPIFKRMFGSEWTDEYVDTVLFPGSAVVRSAAAAEAALGRE